MTSLFPNGKNDMAKMMWQSHIHWTEITTTFIGQLDSWTANSNALMRNMDFQQYPKLVDEVIVDQFLDYFVDSSKVAEWCTVNEWNQHVLISDKDESQGNVLIKYINKVNNVNESLNGSVSQLYHFLKHKPNKEKLATMGFVVHPTVQALVKKAKSKIEGRRKIRKTALEALEEAPMKETPLEEVALEKVELGEVAVEDAPMEALEEAPMEEVDVGEVAVEDPVPKILCSLKDICYSLQQKYEKVQPKDYQNLHHSLVEMDETGHQQIRVVPPNENDVVGIKVLSTIGSLLSGSYDYLQKLVNKMELELQSKESEIALGVNLVNGNRFFLHIPEISFSLLDKSMKDAGKYKAIRNVFTQVAKRLSDESKQYNNLTLDEVWRVYVTYVCEQVFTDLVQRKVGPGTTTKWHPLMSLSLFLTSIW
jgi:hypothetical protein